MAQILTVEEFDRALEDGSHAWPGGYPKYFTTHDGEAMSFEAAKENRDIIAAEIAEGANCGWRVIAVDINWEDGDMVCCHTNKRIPSAYAEDN